MNHISFEYSVFQIGNFALKIVNLLNFNRLPTSERAHRN